MNCAAECCIECYSILELVQVWIEINFEISIRITVRLLRNAPLVVVVCGAGYAYYYLEYKICGRAEAISGNTIKIGNKRVRIYGVVALRRGQELCWRNGVCEDGFHYCKRKLAEKIDGKRVCCRVTKPKGAYDRVEGKCFLGGKDLGKWLVREGYAFADRNYSRRYVDDEKYARKNRNGFHKALPPPPFPKEWKASAERKARQVLIGRFKTMRLPGDPSILSIADLSAKVGIDLSGGILVDPLGEFGIIELW